MPIFHSFNQIFKFRHARFADQWRKHHRHHVSAFLHYFAKKPSSTFAARTWRALLHMWYHARSRAISAGQKFADTCSRGCLAPALIARDRAWYHKIEQCSFRRESRGWFFFLGSFFFLSRVQRLSGANPIVVWWLTAARPRPRPRTDPENREVGNIDDFESRQQTLRSSPVVFE